MRIHEAIDAASKEMIKSDLARYGIFKFRIWPFFDCKLPPLRGQHKVKCYGTIKLVRNLY